MRSRRGRALAGFAAAAFLVAACSPTGNDSTSTTTIVAAPGAGSNPTSTPPPGSGGPSATTSTTTLSTTSTTRPIETTTTTTSTSTTTSSTTTTTRPPPPPPPPPPPEVEIPELPAVDTGVLTDLRFPDPDDPDALFNGLVRTDWSDDAIITLSLDECLLRAPGSWVFSGWLDLPAELAGSDIVVSPGRSWGDIGHTTVVRATVTGSGPFAVPIDWAAEQAKFDQDKYRPADDNISGCSSWLSAAPVAMGRSGDGVGPTYSEEALTWKAPVDSVQALGIGAVLAEPDWRTSWAYATWFGWEIPFETLWVADGMELRSARFDSDRLCRNAHTQDSNTFVRQEQWCDVLPDLASGEPSSLAGWTFVTDRFGTDLVAIDNQVVLSVHDNDTNRDQMVAAAAELQRRRNVWFEELPIPPTASEDLDSAIAARLKRSGRLDERFRTSVKPDEVFFVGIGIRGERLPQAVVREFWAIRLGPYWEARAGGGSGGADWCLDGSASYNGERSYRLVLGAEPSWTLETRRDDGSWRELPSDQGVHFKYKEGKLGLPTPLRALDADGRVIRCSTGGGWLQLGEEWSPYRFPHVTRDLPVTVVEPGPHADGATVTVTGTGFHKSGPVVVHLCPIKSVEWDDWSDCRRSGEDVEYGVRSKRGAITLEDFPLDAEFTTWLGDEINCRSERCVIRVDTVAGLSRWGWVEIEFAD